MTRLRAQLTHPGPEMNSGTNNSLSSAEDLGAAPIRKDHKLSTIKIWKDQFYKYRQKDIPLLDEFYKHRNFINFHKRGHICNEKCSVKCPNKTFIHFT